MKTVEKIYSQGKSFSHYPFRIFFLNITSDQKDMVVFSVPKKHFKRAVKRNKIRRRMREAFRLECCQIPAVKQNELLIVYTAKEVLEYERISESLREAILKIS